MRLKYSLIGEGGNVDISTKINILSLCSGVGGLELGLKLAMPNSRVVAYCEREAYAAAILRKRMEETFLDEAPIWDDVRTFDGKPWRGKVDLITAGFPCQPASTAGKRKGTDDERWIWPDIKRVIREVKPGWVFLENVPGLLSVNSGRAFAEILWDLAQAGFDVRWMCLSAADVGANHKRERVWILAHANGTRKLQPQGVEQNKRRRFGNSGEEVPHALHSRGGWRAEQQKRNQEEGDVADSEMSKCRGSITSRAGGARLTNGSENVADPHGAPREQTFGRVQKQEPNTSSQDVANSGYRSGRNFRSIEERSEKGGRWPEHSGQINRPSWWSVEPDVGRVAHRIPYRVDRLRACGNGVVPLVAAVAWRKLRKVAGV